MIMEKKEIQNILNGQPTYPDVPDLEHEKTKPLPNQRTYQDFHTTILCPT